MTFIKKEYDINYAKEKLKRVPLDIQKDEYELILEHMKKKGYTRLNTYIKDLIRKDMQSGEEVSSDIAAR